MVDEAKPSEPEIPKYAKYVKDILANKSRLAEYEMVELIEVCSTKIQNKLSNKLKYPGSFSFMVKLTIGLGKPKPTTIILLLADRSVAKINGIIKDVFVKIGTLFFPMDHFIFDFESEPEVPFILLHSFLETRGALIDVVADRLTMRAHDKVEFFDIYREMKLPMIYEKLSTVTVIEEERVA
ncbi:uncharacterized protein LOC129875693 [Solanum dulcamara]|uniref:uncharacterized protein LOC129875693 n=1 Tax=Solanum dulcamara TaxID=45834 RepID=UPI0024857517|nr:uncharacterized protein LOC129875693 [Solanum dulcamara]